jgi:hypothetical protein
MSFPLDLIRAISFLVYQSERNGSGNEYRQSVHGYGFRRNGPQGDADVDIVSLTT